MVNTTNISQEKIKVKSMSTALTVKNLPIKSTKEEAIKVHSTKNAKTENKGATKAYSTIGRRTENNPSPN